MATFNFVCVLVVAICFNLVLTAEDIAEDNQERNTVKRLAGRSYSVTTCDYKTQNGYFCLTCNRALHCYPGNIAIQVDCYGFFRFCRDGRCSRFQGDKCFSDNKLSTQNPLSDATMPVADITENIDTNGNVATTIAGTLNTTIIGTTNAGTTGVETTNAAPTKIIKENVMETVTEAVSLSIDTKATAKGDVKSISVNSNLV